MKCHPATSEDDMIVTTMDKHTQKIKPSDHNMYLNVWMLAALR